MAEDIPTLIVPIIVSPQGGTVHPKRSSALGGASNGTLEEPPGATETDAGRSTSIVLDPPPEEMEREALERDGLEMLRKVFDSMAVNGKVTMDQLPFVLVGAEVHATAQEIQEAIEEYLPEAEEGDGYIDFDQVTTLYTNLMQMYAAHHDTMVDVAERKPPFWQRLWHWIQLKRQQRKMRQTAYERQMKPTTRLLLLILVTSCVISAAVVVFAVVFTFQHSDNAVINHIKRDSVLMRDGVSLFGYTRPFEHYQENMERLTSLLGVVIEELGYASSRRNLLSSVAYQQQLLAKLLDGWYESDSLGSVNTSAMLVQAWVNRMVLRGMNQSRVVQVFNAMNPRMPAGHELLLARWNASAGRIDFLTDFKFKAQCVGICGSSLNGSTATRRALAGESGALFGNDYRPAPVVAGYRPLPALGLALVYNVGQSTLRAEFQQPVVAVVNTINAKLANMTRVNSTHAVRQNSQEIVIATQAADASLQVLNALRSCNASCLASTDLDASLLAAAVAGAAGANETADFNGEPVLLAYGPLPSAALGLEVKVAREEFLDTLYAGLGDSLDAVNPKLQDTEEIQFVVAPKSPNASNLVNGVEFYTAYRFAEQCVGACGQTPNTSAYLHRAVFQCESGSAHELDYRPAMVVAGYVCLPSMAAALAITVDDAQILNEGTAMAGTIATYQNNVRYAGKSTEVVVARKKKGVAVAHSARDFDRITVLKHRQDCPNLTCTGPSIHVTRAVNGETGYARGPDYRNYDVMGAYTYIPSLDVGIVVKIDTSEAQAGSFRLTGILCGSSIATVIVSMTILALMTNVLLKSMDRAWDEGKKAIEREKQAFRSVIEAMYPAEVAIRMLAGDEQIAYDVPAATVFFSDIFEFTTTSNTVTPEELIQFMGYTFGTMDAIGDYYRVYKVKTIGDAYLGVTGLPGVDSKEGNTTLDLMLFASACAQVFSNRFRHPDEGTILDTVVTRLLKKKNLVITSGGVTKGSAIPRRPSMISYGHPKDPAGVPPPDEKGAPPPIHCIMRYGLAAGPITAGVLQGKTPLFDIWGKTVNLASRMESTGQAGRIHVSESVYQRVMALKKQPFTFDSRQKVYCKGFGQVNAYFVNTCLIAPPKDLLTSLHIVPNFQYFVFQNPVPDPRAAGKADAGDPRRQSAGLHSAHSSISSGA